mgnify:CR=1 FL=1
MNQFLQINTNVLIANSLVVIALLLLYLAFFKKDSSRKQK